MAAKNEEPKTTETTETTEQRKPLEVPFTDKQLARLQKLQMNVRVAEAVAQSYVDSLAEDLEIDMQKQWTIGPKGFIEVLSPVNPANNGNGNGNGAQTPPMH